MARKEKKYHFIYKTTNKITGRYYFGMHSTDNLDDGYLGSGRRLRYSLNKYGNDNHYREIIEFCIDRKSLINKEKEIVNLNEISKEECMNLMVGRTGGYISKEQQKHRSICANKKLHEKRKIDEEFNKMWLKSLKRAAYQKKINGTHRTWQDNYNWTGKKHSEKTKKLISEKNKGMGLGKDNSQYNTCWITNGFENKKIHKGDIIPEKWYLGMTVKKK